jgi:hypothetical protein
MNKHTHTLDVDVGIGVNGIKDGRYDMSNAILHNNTTATTTGSR